MFPLDHRPGRDGVTETRRHRLFGRHDAVDLQSDIE
jgi:hypothetical protein